MNRSERVVTFNNYFDSTFAIFKGCKKPTREPDYISNSGSEYWYGENKKGKYVIRYSDHWTRKNHGNRIIKRVASCQWEIIGKDVEKYDCCYWAAKCYLNTFVPIL